MSHQAMRRAWTGCALMAAALSAGCSGQKPAAPAGRMTVVATIYPLQDWVRQVGGEAVEAGVLLHPGMSPHSFEPKPSTAREIAQAKVVVAVGLGLDDWVLRLAGDPARVVKLGETPGLDLIKDREGTNPHVWLDPERAGVMVGALEKALAAADPEHAEIYAANARDYRVQLHGLALDVAAQARPHRGQAVITFHAAFNYLLERCGLRLGGAIEPFPGKEPSAEYLQGLTMTARRLGQRVIFAEPQLSAKAARVIAREIGGEVVMLDPLGNPDDPERATYTALVRYDVGEIVRALSAQAQGGDTP